MSEDKKIRALGYVRVSTDRQAEEGFSLDNQRADIQKLCEFKGWELIDVEQDKGISGSTIRERNGMKTVLQRMKKEKIDYLIVWKISRLSRTVADVVYIADKLNKSNSFLYSITDNIDTGTPMGKYFLVLASIFAEMERDNLIVQVRGGMKQKAKEGKWNGGYTPLGYTISNKELEILPEEAEIVVEIFNEYLKGNGYIATAKAMNDKGYKTRKNANFSGGSVKGILTNPTYAGFIRWGKLENWGHKDENGRRKRTYNKEYELNKGIHEPIISQEVFEKVQDMIENNPRRHMKQFNSDNILSGLLRCPDCGYGMSIHKMSSNGKIYEYYQCNQYSNKKTCKPNTIPKEKIETDFLEIFSKFISSNDFYTQMKSSLNTNSFGINEVEKRIKILLKDIDKLKATEKKTLNKYINEDNPRIASMLKEDLEALGIELEEKETERTELQLEIEKLKACSINVEEVSSILKNAGELFPLIEKSAQKNLLRRLIKEIEVEDKQIKKIHFHFNESVDLSSNNYANLHSTKLNMNTNNFFRVNADTVRFFES